MPEELTKIKTSIRQAISGLSKSEKIDFLTKLIAWADDELETFKGRENVHTDYA